MQENKNNKLNYYLIIFSTIILSFSINFVSFYELMPDDAFYYLSIAQNYNEYGEFTFDSGITVTNGFHILWMYFLILCDEIINNEKILYLIIYFQIFASLLSLIIIINLKKFFQISTLGLLIFLTSFTFINNVISGTEWSITLLIHCLIYFFLQNINNKKIFFLFLLGLIGNLSRSDFGATSLLLFLSSLVLFYINNDKKYIFPTLSIFIGSCFGLMIFILHHYGIDQNHIQGSASIKKLWTDATGASPIPILFQILRIFIYLPRLSELFDYNLYFLKFDYLEYLNIVFFTFFIILLYLIRKTISKVIKHIFLENNDKLFLFIASFLILIFYIIFYSFNSQATQHWYSVHFIIPVLFIFTQIYNIFIKKYFKLALISTFIVVSFNSFYLVKTFPTYYQNEHSVKFGNFLKQNYNLNLVALPDNGLVNYIAGNKIINIDGIANNDLLNYKPENFHCFLLDYNIEYFTFFGGNNHKFFELKDLNTYSKIIENNYDLRKINFDSLNNLKECSTT